jgi:ATP-dependent Lon protease
VEEKYQNVLLEEDFFKIDDNKLDISKLTKSLKSNFLSIIDSLKILPEDFYNELNREIDFIDKILDIVDKILNKEKKDLIKIISKTNR